MLCLAHIFVLHFALELAAVCAGPLPPLYHHFTFENSVDYKKVLNSVPGGANGTLYGNAAISTANAKFGAHSAFFGGVAMSHSHADKFEFPLYFREHTFFISMWIKPLKLEEGSTVLLQRIESGRLTTTYDFNFVISCNDDTPDGGYTAGVAEQCSMYVTLRVSCFACVWGKTNQWWLLSDKVIVNEWNFFGLGHNGTAFLFTMGEGFLPSPSSGTFTYHYDDPFVVGNVARAPNNYAFYGFLDELKIYRGNEYFNPSEMLEEAMRAPPTPPPTPFPTDAPTRRPTTAPTQRPTSQPNTSPTTATFLSSTATDVLPAGSTSSGGGGVAVQTATLNIETSTVDSNQDATTSKGSSQTTVIVNSESGLSPTLFWVLVGNGAAVVCILLCVALLSCVLMSRRRKRQRAHRRKGEGLSMSSIRGSEYGDVRSSRRDGGGGGGARRANAGSGRRDRRVSRSNSRHTNVSSEKQGRSRRSVYPEDDGTGGLRSFALLSATQRLSRNAKDGSSPVIYDGLSQIQPPSSVMAPAALGAITYEQLPGGGAAGIEYGQLPTLQRNRPPVYTSLSHVESKDVNKFKL